MPRLRVTKPVTSPFAAELSTVAVTASLPGSGDRVVDRDGDSSVRRLQRRVDEPGARAAAGVGQVDRDGAAVDGERDRAGRGEEQGVVGAHEVDQAAALPEHGDLATALVANRRPGLHERRLDLRDGPRRMPLQEQGCGAGDLRCGHARPRHRPERARLVHRQRRGDRDAWSRDVGLQLERHRAWGRPRRSPRSCRTSVVAATVIAPGALAGELIDP